MRYLIILFILLSTHKVNDRNIINYPVEKHPNEKERILKAFIQVESSGNIFAYNKKERAAGILQIRPIMVREVNRLYDTDYKLVDRYDSIKSVQMFILYQSHYSRKLTIELMARKWNAGPDGMSQLKATENYYTKIKDAYASID